ncbi:MAG: hypothetical protein WBL25_13060 [Anaerolineales bacterium]
MAMALIGEYRGWNVEVGFELLSKHTDLQVLGDKAYINAEKATQLWMENRWGMKPVCLNWLRGWDRWVSRPFNLRTNFFKPPRT